MDFKTLTNIIFFSKKDWRIITNEEKESLFFIFNRFMSKQYPKQAQLFNVKNIDKATCMDIWFNFLKKEFKVPFWFWKGPTKKKSPDIKGWEIIQEFNNQIRTEDIFTLCKLFPKEVKEEIKRLEEIVKEQKS